MSGKPAGVFTRFSVVNKTHVSSLSGVWGEGGRDG